MRILLLSLTLLLGTFTSFAAELPADKEHTILATVTDMKVYNITIDAQGKVVKINNQKLLNDISIVKAPEVKANEETLKNSIHEALKNNKQTEIATLGKYDTLDSVASGAINVVGTVGGIIGSFAPKIAELAAFI